jgi:hypothetical protein
MKVVFVCGPFTAHNAWDIECNIRRAEEVAYHVAMVGASPLCPHANTRFFEGTMTPEFWYSATMELMKRCDALITVEGWERSKGARREIDEAGHRPVFNTIGALDSWLRVHERVEIQKEIPLSKIQEKEPT